MNEKQKIDVKELIQIDKELLDNISALVEHESTRSLQLIFSEIHSADIAEIINHLSFEDATFTFHLLDTETASEVITELDENLREKILKDIDAERIIDIIDELDADDAADIVSDLPEQVVNQVLENIDQEISDEVKELLKYPEDSAGGMMNSIFVHIYEDQTVADAIEQVRENAEDIDDIYHIYVLKRDDILVGYVELKSLIINKKETKINTIMEEELIYITPEMDQEEAANTMQKYDLVSIPVVDENKRMIGRITIDDALSVLQDEASEDMQKFAGLAEEQESSDSIFRISRIRLPWLIIGLVIEFIGANIFYSFQKNLEAYLIASVFIPVVLAMGGSSGSQAAIVMVRGLTLGDIWINDSFKNLFKEFKVSIFNGLIIGCILFLLAFSFQFLFAAEKNFLFFATIVSGSLFLVVIFSSFLGALIPVVFKKLKIDPAIATGPFVTTMNDITGIVIYLSTVQFCIHNFL